MTFPRSRTVCRLVGLLCLTLVCGFSTAACRGQATSSVVEHSLGETRNVHRCGNLYLSGQFTEADIAQLKECGIRRVISLRTEGEVKWDQRGALESTAWR